MGMLEIHAKALNSSNVPYHEFLLSYKTNAFAVYGFVEGKDDPSFYRGIIKNYLPSGWNVELIRAGNKDKVLETLDGMDLSRFPKKRVCFFVDRDLSDFLGEEQPSAENLYVTDNYSIENDAITFETMQCILEDILDITKLKPTETETIKELFHSNLNTFRESMAPVMSQILIWRRNGGEINLNNVQPRKLFKFVEGKIDLEEKFTAPISRIEYAGKCVNATIATDDELREIEAEFRSKQGIEKFIRGKYLLWFFVECALQIHSAIPKFCANHSTAPKMRLSLGFCNAMVTIAPRVRCPDTLRRFVEFNYLEYIKEVGLVV